MENSQYLEEVSIKSGLLSLRKLRHSDRKLVIEWLSDPEILNLTFVSPQPDCHPLLPIRQSALEQYVDVLIADEKRFTFAIILEGIHVGNIGIKEYFRDLSVAECFIEIGLKENRGKGIGHGAMAMLLNFAFGPLSLTAMRLEVLEFNESAIRLYDRLGFVRTHRSGYHYDALGKAWKVWSMTLSKEIWMGEKVKGR